MLNRNDAVASCYKQLKLSFIVRNDISHSGSVKCGRSQLGGRAREHRIDAASCSLRHVRAIRQAHPFDQDVCLEDQHKPCQAGEQTIVDCPVIEEWLVAGVEVCIILTRAGSERATEAIQVLEKFASEVWFAERPALKFERFQRAR